MERTSPGSTLQTPTRRPDKGGQLRRASLRIASVQRRRCGLSTTTGQKELFVSFLESCKRMSKKIMWASVLAGAFAPLVLYWLQNIADDNHPGPERDDAFNLRRGRHRHLPSRRQMGTQPTKEFRLRLFLNTATATPTSWRTASPSKN
jgi:hypothetical protein